MGELVRNSDGVFCPIEEMVLRTLNSHKDEFIGAINEAMQSSGTPEGVFLSIRKLLKQMTQIAEDRYNQFLTEEFDPNG